MAKRDSILVREAIALEHDMTVASRARDERVA